MKLTDQGCRERQKRLCSVLEKRGLSGAIISRRVHVLYLTGLLYNRHHAAGVYLGVDGRLALVCAEGAEAVAVDDLIFYEPSFLATMHSRQFEAVAEKLAPVVPFGAALGSDFGGGVAGITQLGGPDVDDLTDDLRSLRKRKLPDEVAAIQAAIEITEAMYAAAREAAQPGADEIDVFNAIRTAAVAFAGEDIEHCGNDFRANDMGGLPRRRRMEAGELYILDAGPSLHGYFADNCRTFSVGASPSSAQMQAWEMIDSLFPVIEAAVRPGVPASEVFAIANRALSANGYEGLVHHLGHGIGLTPHETPELNPNYDAVFEVGDVFTMEPGLYSPELRAGIRLEENYVLEEDGPRQLTSFPRALC